MRNKFPGTCACGKHVAAGQGHFQKVGRGWIVRCIPCVKAGREAKEARRKAQVQSVTR